jgi:hypothetical protein
MARATSGPSRSPTSLDHDGQNDLLIGGSDLLVASEATIGDYVPGFPIEQSANPTHSFASIPYLYDMVTADFDDDEVSVGIHRGNGDGTFAPYEAFKAKGYAMTGAGEPMIAVGDFDRDGRPDLVTVGRYDEWASVLLSPEPSEALLGAASLGSLLALARRRAATEAASRRPRAGARGFRPRSATGGPAPT